MRGGLFILHIYMYSKIVNPKTGRKVLTKSRLGKQILQKYVVVMSGGSSIVKPPITLFNIDTETDSDDDLPMSPLSPRMLAHYLPERLHRFTSDPELAWKREEDARTAEDDMAEVQDAANTAGRFGMQMLQNQQVLKQEKRILKDQNERLEEKIILLESNNDDMEQVIRDKQEIILKIQRGHTSVIDNLKRKIKTDIVNARENLMEFIRKKDLELDSTTKIGRGRMVTAWEKANAVFQKKIDAAIN